MFYSKKMKFKYLSRTGLVINAFAQEDLQFLKGFAIITVL